MRDIFRLTLLAGILSVSGVWGATGTELTDAYETMREPRISGTRVLQINNQTIEHKNFTLRLDSGLFYLFDPIQIDSAPVDWGGLFVGQAHFYFKPGIAMEQEQLRRFYGVDALDVQVKEVELCLDRGNIAQLVATGKRAVQPITDRVRRSVEEHHQFLLTPNGKNMLWSILKGVVAGDTQSFVLVNSALGKFGQSVYRYDPFQSEEVSLWVNPWELAAERTLKLVCSYSEFSSGRAATINGLNKDQLSVSHYDLITWIDSKGRVTVEANLKGLVEKPWQVIKMVGPARMRIDSITLNDSVPVAFYAVEDSATNHSDLWLAIDEMTTPGTTARLSFYYQPDLPSRWSAGYIELDAANWFPIYARQRSSFSMEFHTPGEQTLVVSGKMMNRQESGNRLITSWYQELPVRHISFSLGLNRKYNFTSDKHSSISLAYNPRLIASENYTFDREKLIVEELSNAKALLSHNFGPYQFSSLNAAPMPDLVSQSYPSVIGLSARKIGQTEVFKADPYLFSSATAGQWWGVAVDHSSYHDGWLTDGLVRYSAYMYLQATQGNLAIFERLDRDALEIFSACPNFPNSTNECGPIALGERTIGSRMTDNHSEAVVHKKAAWVFHMLRNLLLDLGSMSDELFLNMMREWYRTKAGKLVSTAEFIQLTEKYVKEDMNWFFDQYIYSTELPTYYFSYDLSQLAGGRTQAICHVRQEGVGEGFKMYVPLEIEFVTGEKTYLRLLIDQTEGDIELPPIVGGVKSIKLNPFHSVLCRVKD